MTDQERIATIAANAATMHNLMQRPLDIKWLVEECPIEEIETYRRDQRAE